MSSGRRRILLIDGHPDPHADRFVHALCAAYATGARDSGHDVRTIALSELSFPLLRTASDFNDSAPCTEIWHAQQAIAWAQHVVILFPLWLGTMPALLKAFLEQVFRPRFAFRTDAGAHFPTQLLKGRTARIVVTMGMPSLLYRSWFGAYGVKTLKRSILSFSGFGPVRTSLIGAVEAIGARRRGAWIERMMRMGRRAG